MRNSLNFDKTLPYFNDISNYETTLFCTFWFYLIPKLVFEVLLQTFMWCYIVNTPVTLVTVNVALF